MSNVLVVEDDFNSAALLGNIVKTTGHDYVHVSNAHDAIQAIYEHDFALIIMDLRLPGGMDGWELGRRLRQDSNTQHIPLLAVSVEAQEDDRSRAFEAGYDDYIAKPFSVAQLRQYLTDILTV